MPEEQKNPLGFGCQVKSCQNKRKKTNGEKEGSVKRSNKSLTILTMPKKKSPGLCFQWRLLNGKKFKTKIPNRKKKQKKKVVVTSRGRFDK